MLERYMPAPQQRFAADADSVTSVERTEGPGWKRPMPRVSSMLFDLEVRCLSMKTPQACVGGCGCTTGQAGRPPCTIWKHAHRWSCSVCIRSCERLHGSHMLAPATRRGSLMKDVLKGLCAAVLRCTPHNSVGSLHFCAAFLQLEDQDLGEGDAAAPSQISRQLLKLLQPRSQAEHQVGCRCVIDSATVDMLYGSPS